MLKIQKIYLTRIVIYHFYKKERKLKNVLSLFVTYMMRKPYCSHKSFKTSTTLWINTKKITQSNSTSSKSHTLI